MARSGDLATARAWSAGETTHCIRCPVRSYEDEASFFSAETSPATELTHDWRSRLAIIVDTMREMSRQTDPQEMVRTYGERMRQLLPIDRRFSLSRRDLEAPKYRITRSTTWTEDLNPWKEKDRLPLLEGGLLAELIYGDEPQVIDDLHVAADDPAARIP